MWIDFANGAAEQKLLACNSQKNWIINFVAGRRWFIVFAFPREEEKKRNETKRKRLLESSQPFSIIRRG